MDRRRIDLRTIEPFLVREIRGSLSRGPAFLLVCVLGPITEEILDRGLVYEHCLRFLPVAGAILLNSLLFAVAHGSPVQMAVAFAAGLLFSLARKKTGTVTAPVIMHILINLSVSLF